MTGSGKTTLAEHLLASHRNVVALDLKHDLKWPNWRITNDPNIAMDVSTGHAIFRPKNKDVIEKVFARARKQGGWTIYIDEDYLLGPKLLSPRGGESEYVLCLTSGRSKGVTIFTSTQRPKYLPLFAGTEAVHIFVFALGEDDAKELAALVGADDLRRLAKSEEQRKRIRLGTYKFLYINRKKDISTISKMEINK